ncbi:DUF6526 family protein [Aridibaculum aurantiacum]|uniref:DUF6526 family protein n=1 Tax=Aridibaculum aurantiacum TaxID=2810307 RepID=UPI001A9635DC|nr:DUF6526 family protein [Aridibaculum aurantiacum]
MSSQNFKNHSRISFSFHILTVLPLVATVVGAIMNLVNSSGDNLYSASLILLMSVLLLSIAFHARLFALKAQDRAIRAEENLRHFVLTQKPLDPRLRMGQIIALRFAPDAEFPQLAARAAAEGLSNKQIKQAISNWKADHHRV